MRIVYYLNCVSTHELPVILEMVKLVGYENVLYVDAGLGGQAFQTVDARQDLGVRVLSVAEAEAREALESWDVMTTGIRDVELFRHRQSRGLKTFYGSERWFKPWHGLPGWVKMFVPSFRKRAKAVVSWLNEDPNAYYFAEGPWAKKDFIKMGVKEEKIVDWGYYVAPSTEPRVRNVECGVRSDGTLKVLWAGRDLGWKRVSDIERAVARVNAQFKAQGLKVNVEFTKLTGVTPEEVRKAMRENDLFVLASNAYEGWGAVVSEALEEGMNVIGTYECGSCPAMLPKERLYHCGDIKALKKLIELELYGALPPCSVGEWTAEKAAKRLLRICQNDIIY